jgi:hypothetical protein
MSSDDFTEEQRKAFRAYACATLSGLNILKSDLDSTIPETLGETIMMYVTEIARNLMIQEGIL